ncbi:acyl carrier protein [Streptomyces alboniger]|uniref:Acyl carrier protein n=1 Tax=Streptomyces alboniger TaxID=132473 RepID=A0A5J6HD80_STRAD|nr:acyl carrier protein [Streptomyces alboniger]QEV16540.1 acyl carrier protein [Streptomyces alboniger]
MTQNTDVLRTVAKLVEEVTGINAAEVTPEKSLVEDLDIDSLSMVEITVAVEEAYGVKFPEGSTAGLKTVGDVVGFITEDG